MEGLGLEVSIEGLKESDGQSDILIEIREERIGQKVLPLDVDIKDSLFFIQAYIFNYPLVKNAAKHIIDRGGLAVVGGIDTFVRRRRL